LQDVLVSLALTFLILFFAIKFFDRTAVDSADGKKSACSKRTDALLSLVILLASTVVIIIVAYFNFTGAVEVFHLRDAAIAAGAAIGFAFGIFIERNYICFSTKAQNLPLQAVKFLLGAAGTIAVQEGARIIGSGLVATGARYFLIVMWMTVFFPLIIKRFFTKAEFRQTGNA
jgi:hypothetical protein